MTSRLLGIDDLIDRVLLGDSLTTPLGWRIKAGSHQGLNTRAIANWPVQSIGADIMRIATTAMVEHGLEVCAPIHDAVLVQGDVRDYQEIRGLAEKLMRESSEAVLGVPCGFEVEVVREGDRYVDPKGAEMFARITKIIDEHVSK